MKRYSIRLRHQHVQELKDSLDPESHVKLEHTTDKKRRASVSSSRIVRAASIAMSKTRNFFSMTGQLVSKRRKSYDDSHLPEEQCAWGMSTDVNDNQFSGEIRGIPNLSFTASESTEKLSQTRNEDETLAQADVHSASNTFKITQSSSDQDNTTALNTNRLSVNETKKRKTSAMSTDSGVGQSRPTSAISVLTDTMMKIQPVDLEVSEL